MSENTQELWRYAKKHGISYDTVVAALEMVEFEPKEDIYAILSNPTDSQKMTLRSKLMGVA